MKQISTHNSFDFQSHHMSPISGLIAFSRSLNQDGGNTEYNNIQGHVYYHKSFLTPAWISKLSRS